VQQSSSPSPINQTIHSIRWAHNIASMTSPTDSDLVKHILEGAKRRLSVPIKKKEPITPDLLSKMYDKKMIKCSVIQIYIHSVPLVPAY